MLTSVSKAEAFWAPTTATVTGWRRTYDTWFVDEAIADEAGGYQLAKFVISFSYSVRGSLYAGTYTAGSPKEIGETFELKIDPDNPERNTGSDRTMRPWVRVAAWSIGIALALLLARYAPNAGW